MPTSISKAIGLCSEEHEKTALEALLRLCRGTDHRTGMRTQGGCACGASAGGGPECTALGLLLSAFISERQRTDTV